MAFDPFAAVDHPPQVTQCSVDMQTENLLDRMDRTHLIGHGADAADPSDNVRHFVVMPPLQEGLEKPRRLENLQLHILNPAVFHRDAKRTLPLNTRNRADGDGSRILFSLRLRLSRAFHFSPLTFHWLPRTPHPSLLTSSYPISRFPA
jgi:hypothetical protein